MVDTPGFPAGFRNPTRVMSSVGIEPLVAASAA